MADINYLRRYPGASAAQPQAEEEKAFRRTVAGRRVSNAVSEAWYGMWQKITERRYLNGRLGWL